MCTQNCKKRGVEDILIACADGLNGFPDAINTAYPETQIQLCIVHMIRNSLRFVSWKDYKAVTAYLKRIYQADTEEIALMERDTFSEQWDDKDPQISKKRFTQRMLFSQSAVLSLRRSRSVRCFHAMI